jgi:hypothetical protein
MRAFMVEEIEEHEWLQDLAETGWADQACGGTMRSTAGTLHDRPSQARRRRFG